MNLTTIVLVSFEEGRLLINPQHVVALQAIRIADPDSPPGLNFKERKEIDATRIYLYGEVHGVSVSEPIDEVAAKLMVLHDPA